MGRTYPRDNIRTGGGDRMIFIAWHMGLGDAIACAAIVAKIAKENPGETITIPCWERNKISVESFFVNHVNVKTEVVENDNWMLFELSHRVIVRIGVYNKSIPQNKEEDFVQWFYRQAGIDISEKEIFCPIRKITKELPQLDICFIHEDTSRGFTINRKFVPCSFPATSNHDSSRSILSYANVMMEAKEVHCIDSSFLHLAEALNVTGKKVYHKYARPESTDFKYIKGWEVIDAE